MQVFSDAYLLLLLHLLGDGHAVALMPHLLAAQAVVDVTLAAGGPPAGLGRRLLWLGLEQPLVPPRNRTLLR